MIMLHEDNVIDKMIQKLPEKAHTEIHERYKTICPNPKTLKFIDRLEIDSREPALAHTGGLSCPQQALMCLFSIFELLDTQNRYKDAIHYLLRKRIKNLYDSMDEPVPEEKGNTYYYTLIDLIHVSQKKYGPAFGPEEWRFHETIGLIPKKDKREILNKIKKLNFEKEFKFDAIALFKRDNGWKFVKEYKLGVKK